MRRQDREHKDQVAYFAWLSMAHPKYYRSATAVPLGGIRKPKTGAKLKAEGVKAGYPDVLIDVPLYGYHGLRFEFKAPGKTQSSVTALQREWLVRLWNFGYAVGWAPGFESAMQLTEAYFRGTYVWTDWLPRKWVE